MCSNVGSICRLQYQCSRIHVLCGMHTCSGAHSNNVKYMFTRVSDHIVDCSGFIGGIYTDIEVLYMDMN